MARRAMARTVTQVVAPHGVACALTLDPDVEQNLLDLSHGRPPETPAALAPDDGERWRRLVEELLARHRRPGQPLTLLCHAHVRLVLARVLASLAPRLIVLEPGELLAETQIDNVHTITPEELDAVPVKG
jgi:flagellar biosynthesis component FlhA